MVVLVGGKQRRIDKLRNRQIYIRCYQVTHSRILKVITSRFFKEKRMQFSLSSIEREYVSREGQEETLKEPEITTVKITPKTPNCTKPPKQKPQQQPSQIVSIYCVLNNRWVFFTIASERSHCD